MFAQHAFQACYRRFPTLGIELSHPLDMAREAPFGNEGCDDGLRKHGAAPGKGLADLLEPSTCVSGTARYASRMLGKSTLLKVPV